MAKQAVVDTCHYSAIERSEKILIDATAWLDLENIMPSEINLTQKGKYSMVIKCELPRMGTFIETEK